jgi:hypothetical protein
MTGLQEFSQLKIFFHLSRAAPGSWLRVFRKN